MPRRLRRTTRYRRRYARRPMRVRKSRYRRKAASQQKQRANFTIKSSLYGNIIIAPTGASGDTPNVPNFSGTTAFSAYLNLIKSNYFLSLLKMYDQVRLNSVKIKITPTQSVLLAGQAQSVFVSAWDRNGLNNAAEAPSFSEIASYSSAFQKAINLQATTWNATRMIRASTIQEKSFFIPTGQIMSIFGSSASESGALIGQGQSLITPWNPQLLFGVLVSSPAFVNGVLNPNQNVLANTQTWNYFAECEWNVTFRGVRYDIGGSAPIVNATTVSNTTAAMNVGSVEQPIGQDVQSTLLSSVTVPVSAPTNPTPSLSAVYVSSGDVQAYPASPTVVVEPKNIVGTEITPSSSRQQILAANSVYLCFERANSDGANTLVTWYITGSEGTSHYFTPRRQCNYVLLYEVTTTTPYGLSVTLTFQGQATNQQTITRTVITELTENTTGSWNLVAGNGPVYLTVDTTLQLVLKALV